MNKIFVLDSNVPLSDSLAILKFEEHSVIIPQILIDEIDGKKKEVGELGYCSRQFSRLMDELSLKGNLCDGIEIGNQGGKLFVQPYTDEIAACLPFQNMSIVDNKIIATAIYIKQQNPNSIVTLVSNDTNVRVNCNVFGIIAEDYKNGKIETDEQYSGVRHIDVPQQWIDSIYANSVVQWGEVDIKFADLNPLPNECFIFHSEANTKQSALLRYNSVMKEFRLLPQDMKTVDILPKNAEQQFALDLLKDSEVNLVSMTGKAGSGKTLMALAAGLYGVLEVQRYSKVLLLKPIVAMDNGHELGFLPGTMEEKLSPWMASYADNIELIMAGYVKDTSGTATKKPKGISKADWEVLQEKQAGRTNPIQELIASGLLELGSLEHIRGRSLPNQYIIIDEAQNLTLHALKTIITRVGEGTKIILMGDTSQIDSPYLDSRSNGLSLCIEKMKECDIAGHITFRKSERSRLAELAADLL